MVPAWILDVFTALMLLVAAVSAARLVAARRQQTGTATADIDVAHLLMGIAMAGTLTAALTTLPDTAWEVIFGLTTAWFAWRVWRDASANGVRALAGGHCAPHLVHSGAMLYMFLAAAAPAAGSGMGGMGGAAGTAMRTLGYPTLAFVFALILAGYAVWDLDQLSGRRYSLAGAAVSLVPSGVPAMAAALSATVAFSGPTAAGDLARMEASPAGAAVPGKASGSRFAPPAVLLSPGTTVGCRIVMGVTMAFMLAIMI
jgi:Domain of unknown function (DUF5134)